MDTKYHIIKSHKELKQLAKACIKTGYCSYDFETNAVPIYNKDFKPTILSVTFQAGSGCSIPLDHFETNDYTEPGWNWKKELKWFGSKVIENRSVVKQAWNAKFDNQVMEKYNIFYRGTLIDGMLAKYVLDENKPHDLKSMVRRYIPDHGDYEKQEAFDKIPWDQKELKPLCQYGCTDTDMTHRLCLFFEKRLIDVGMYDLYRNMIMTASRVLTSVEKKGLYLDRDFNQELLESYKPKIDKALDNVMQLPRVKKFQKYWNDLRIDTYLKKIEAELDELNPDDPKDLRKIKSREAKITNVRAGIYSNKTERALVAPINLNSNRDLPALMFSKEGFGFEVIKETESGKPSTDEETLVKLRLTVKDPKKPKAIFLDNLLDLRGLEKMYKTYILGWSEKVQDDSCIHGRLNIQGTESGRLSCIAGDSLVLTPDGEIPIQDIPDVPFPKAMTREGWKDITHFIYKGTDYMYEVTLDDGTTIKCTLDHIFITNRGPRKLREIYNSSRGTISNKYKLLKYEEQ